LTKSQQVKPGAFLDTV